MNIELSKWQNDVTEVLENIHRELSKIPNVSNLYYGFEVIDGPLIVEPDILFVGINPGKGDSKRHYSVIFNSEQISYLDVYDDSYKYKLAEDTIDLFKMMGYNDFQIRDIFSKKVVKTNLYHIATDSQPDLEIIKRTYPQLYHHSISHFLKLVKLIRPKIVVFEGKSVYLQIVEEIYEHKNTWNSKLKVGNTFIQQDQMWLFGYERHFSNIQNKEVVSVELKKIIDKICR